MLSIYLILVVLNEFRFLLQSHLNQLNERPDIGGVTGLNQSIIKKWETTVPGRTRDHTVDHRPSTAWSRQEHIEIEYQPSHFPVGEENRMEEERGNLLLVQPIESIRVEEVLIVLHWDLLGLLEEEDVLPERNIDRTDCLKEWERLRIDLKKRRKRSMWITVWDDHALGLVKWQGIVYQPEKHTSLSSQSWALRLHPVIHSFLFLLSFISYLYFTALFSSIPFSFSLFLGLVPFSSFFFPLTIRCLSLPFSLSCRDTQKDTVSYSLQYNISTEMKNQSG